MQPTEIETIDAADVPADALILSFDGQGRAHFVYDDRLAGLLELGAGQVDRASHVEPDPRGGWQADMRPVNGPILRDGERGYRLRSEALAAERAWLRANLGI